METIIVGSAATKVAFFFLFAFAITIPCLEAADFTEYNDHLLKKKEEAEKANLEAYVPNPENVTSEFNYHVHRAWNESVEEAKEYNSTRRGLGSRKKFDGPCMATNPIDRCWRCDPKWHNDRFKLVKCVQGFGRMATGGLGGQIYVVTDNSDDDVAEPKPGTLRYGVIQKEPLWITFARSMNIVLKQELLVTSNKTIDGRGAQVQIFKGAGITMQHVRNVIIHNLRINDVVPTNGGMIRSSVDHLGQRTRADGDAISVFGSSDIWIDHISMSNAADGLVDVIAGCTAVTISNCHMTRHNDVMLFGASDTYEGDKIMQVTLAFNHFGKGLIQRMPRCRWGFFHVVNNDYTHWEMYAIGGTSSPTILSQGNRYIAQNDLALKEVTHRDMTVIGKANWKSWKWRSENDLFLNGAFFVESGEPFQTMPFSNREIITPKDGTTVTRLTRFSGALHCRIGKPC